MLSLNKNSCCRSSQLRDTDLGSGRTQPEEAAVIPPAVLVQRRRTPRLA